MKKTSKIYVAGHTGLVGSSIIKTLLERGYTNIVVAPRNRGYNLTNFSAVHKIFNDSHPEYVFMAAAKVGGINANITYSGEFIRDNLLIQTNVLETARLYGVKKLLFLGSSCIYPKFAEQPIKEEYLLNGELESSNMGYALAKIVGTEMCKAYRKQWGCNFISAMPSNLYGENDNFSYENSHVLPAMIRKFHEAKVNEIDRVEMWGTGNIKREFLHVNDLADALIFLMNNYDKPQHINVGTGEDITIKELSNIVKEIVGYEGEIAWNPAIPDGTPRKLLDVSKINDLGWRHKIGLHDGIKKTYNWFKENYNTIRI